MGESVAKELMQEPRPPVEGERLAKVGVNLGITKSVGNYEFIKVDCYFEDYCESDKKQELFDRLLCEAKESLSVFVENFPRTQRMLAKGVTLARSVENGEDPACKQTKFVLFEEMKIHFGEDYNKFVDVIKESGGLTENQAREAVWQLRNGSNQFFGDLIQSNIEKRQSQLEMGVANG